MTKVFIMVGVPGAGKSTLAKELAEKEHAVILSADNIREMEKKYLEFSTLGSVKRSSLKRI